MHGDETKCLSMKVIITNLKSGENIFRTNAWILGHGWTLTFDRKIYGGT